MKIEHQELRMNPVKHRALLAVLLLLVLFTIAGCSSPAASADIGPTEDSVPPDSVPPDGRPDFSSDLPVSPDVIPDTTADSTPDADTAIDGDGPVEDPTHLEQLSSALDYAQLQGVYDHVLFLLRVDGRQAPAPLDAAECTFQDTIQFPSHMEFLTHFEQLSQLTLEEYCDMVEGTTRVLWGGRLIQHPTVTHPRTKQLGVIVYQLYQDPVSETLSVAQFVEVDQRLKGCVPYANQQLALLAIGSQVPQIEQIEPQLHAQGVDVVYAHQLP